MLLLKIWGYINIIPKLLLFFMLISLCRLTPHNIHYNSVPDPAQKWCYVGSAVSDQLTSFGLSYKQKSFTLERLFMLQSENPATRVLLCGQQREFRVFLKQGVHFPGLHLKN